MLMCALSVSRYYSLSLYHNSKAGVSRGFYLLTLQTKMAGETVNLFHYLLLYNKVA